MRRPEGTTDGDPLAKARQKVYRLLALKDRSEPELRRKLIDSGFDEGVIEQVLAGFRQQGYIDDEAYVRRRIAQAGALYGDRRIELLLTAKGIDRERVREAIAEFRGKFPEREALEALVRKEMEKKRITFDETGRRRLSNRLLRLGFSASLVYEMLHRFTEEHKYDD